MYFHIFVKELLSFAAFLFPYFGTIGPIECYIIVNDLFCTHKHILNI